MTLANAKNAGLAIVTISKPPNTKREPKAAYLNQVGSLTVCWVCIKKGRRNECEKRSATYAITLLVNCIGVAVDLLLHSPLLVRLHVVVEAMHLRL